MAQQSGSLEQSSGPAVPEAVGKQEGFGLRLAGKGLAAVRPPASLAGAQWLMLGSFHSALACNKT